MIDSQNLLALKELERKILWLASWTIHNANHVRKEADDIKVGGHQASCASIVTLMTALYLHILRPEDRVAVKPHASPVFHAIQYLLGRQTREKLENFRAYGGAQSYPSRTKDIDDVDFSTGSVGLGVAVTAFASLVQDYIDAKPWGRDIPKGRMIALVGDAELDEGNIYECLQEGWKHGLRNTWWVIDFNRQSLDGVVREGLYERLESVFRAFGWDVVTIKYGALQKAAFGEVGGEVLRTWIDQCPNTLYSALMFQGGAAWRTKLTEEIGQSDGVADLLARRTDDELSDLMANLGGHCLETVVEAFEAVNHDRPTVFIAYTVKGWRLPLAGHKDNHAGLMTPQHMDVFRDRMKIRAGREWDPFEGLSLPASKIQKFLDAVPFAKNGHRRLEADRFPVPVPTALTDKAISTQSAFGKILDFYARDGSSLSDRIVTTSPDVTVSTNLGAWVNRREIFSSGTIADLFRDQRIPSAQKWRFSPEGQHIELGIAEMNLFLLLAAAGLSHSLFGERLLPIGTVYDPFISRGLDALNYACYQDARFLLVATPSGISLAPEGGAHQSVATPLIGLSQDGLVAFEPAFADELSVIMAWAFDYMQREADGGSVYLRLSTRPLEQPRREMTKKLEKAVIDGAYWMREPGPNCEVVIVYQGAIASEAIAAAGLIGEDRRDVGVLAVTSSDRLFTAWRKRQQAAVDGRYGAGDSHVERLLSRLPNHCRLVTVIDGHPATLSWMAGVCGHRTVSLGVDEFGQTGRIQDLYRHYGIDAASIADAAHRLIPGRPVRHLRAAG